MKRPKFFEDLDRSLSGEPEPLSDEEKELASAMARWACSPLEHITRQAEMYLRRREAEEAQRAAKQRALGIDQATATGALIAAQQRHEQHLSCISSNFAPNRFPFD